MTIGLIGYKCGMTNFFSEDGVSIPVTVIKFYANRIIRIKSCKTDGYNAVQVSVGSEKESRLSKPLIGLYKKYNLSFARYNFEFKISATDLNMYKSGMELSPSLLNEGGLVNVTGISKGKGFSIFLRTHFRRQQMSTFL